MGNKDVNKSAEELSALMDGEVSELELRRVLKNIEDDQALCQKWSRYQLASSILGKQTQGQASRWLNVDISARVQQRLENEPGLAVQATEKNRFAAILSKPFTNVAVAASVSAAVILGWQNFSGGPSIQSAPAVTASASAPPVLSAQPMPSANSPLMAVSQSNGVSNNATNYARILQPDIIRYNPELDNRLNYYMLSHSSNAAMNTASGVTPYARVLTLKPASEPTTNQVNVEK